MVFVWHPIIIFKCARGNIIEQQNVEASFLIEYLICQTFMVMWEYILNKFQYLVYNMCFTIFLRRKIYVAIMLSSNANIPTLILTSLALNDELNEWSSRKKILHSCILHNVMLHFPSIDFPWKSSIFCIYIGDITKAWYSQETSNAFESHVE